MKVITWILLSSVMASATARANDSFNAEFSHFAGNTAIASLSTIAVDKYWPENTSPAMTGFTISASEAFLGEVADYAQGGHLSWLDVGVGILGAATGAYATDKLYIAPKFETQNGDKTYGMVVVYKF